MPAMTGQLKWATELKAKMSFSVKSFKDLNHPICYKEGAKAVFRKYKEMMGLLGTFEDKVFEDWNQSITKKISQSLSRSLILRDENRGILRVNFGRDLGSILREVSQLFVYNFRCLFTFISSLLTFLADCLHISAVCLYISAICLHLSAVCLHF